MNRTEHLLSCLAEECCEIGQRVSKALRFGLDEVQPGQELSNADRIRQEVVDFIAVYSMLGDAGLLGQIGPLDKFSIEEKKVKVEKFMRYAAEQGALQAEGTQS